MDSDVTRFLRDTSAPPDWTALQGAAAAEYLAQVRQPRAHTVPPDLAAVPVTDTATDDGTPVRIYSGHGALIVYLHGGGWVMGDLELNDVMCRRLSREFGFVIVSVDYRLAPEHPFPVPLDDCYAATVWAAAQAPALGADSRLLVMGTSAGGNLAAATALLARDRGTPAIDGQILVYPVLDGAMASESYRSNGSGYFLEREQMRWYWQQYTPGAADRGSALASPLAAADLTGLPPALIVTAGLDPLRDEGEQYAARLREAGVRAQYRCYEEQIHGFLGLHDAISAATPATIEVGEMITALLAG